MFLIELIQRIKYWRKEDRISPENLYSHWMLYFRSTMVKLCKKKFKYFDSTAEMRPGVYVSYCSKISIGKRVVIRPGTRLYATEFKGVSSGITIEDDVSIGGDVHIYTSKHSFYNLNIPIIDQGMDKSKDVVLKKGCYIGAGVIILPGVTIGENAVVGAGSIVEKDIPARSLAIGNRDIRILNLSQRQSESGQDF